MGSFWSKRKRAEKKPPQKNFCHSLRRSSPTKGEIESHAMKRVESIIRNEDSKKLLKEFLQKGHRSDKSDALVCLECYEICDRILSDVERNQTYLDDLIEVCPTYLWEQKINNARNANATDETNWQLEEVLNDLKKECVHEMEGNHDFARFRLDLVKKYQK